MPGKLKDVDDGPDAEDESAVSMKGGRMHCSVCNAFLPNDTAKGIKQHLKSKTHKQNVKNPQGENSAKKVIYHPSYCIPHSFIPKRLCAWK